MGLRLDNLGTPALTWRDLRVIVSNLPASSALSRARFGDVVAWSTTDHLLALTADLLAWANWQRGGGRGQKPRPIERPGQKREAAAVGSGAIPISDFSAWWDEGVTE